MKGELELIVDAKAALGEGPTWDAKRGILYWVDILKKQLHVYDPKCSENRTITLDQYIGCLAPREDGGLVMGMHHGIYLLDESMVQLEKIDDPEQELPDNRFNDGKCDPSGRFWAGTMALTGDKPTGALYRLNHDLSVERMVVGVRISNGLAWSLDGHTMFYIDTATQSVDAFDYTPATGDIGNRRTVIPIPEGDGAPDGMTMDAEGMLWIAHWGGWQVARWNPATGEKLDAIPVPASLCTSCVFGGENLDELYITTAREGLNDQQLAGQPNAGGLFRIKLDVKGTSTYVFKG